MPAVGSQPTGPHRRSHTSGRAAEGPHNPHGTRIGGFLCLGTQINRDYELSNVNVSRVWTLEPFSCLEHLYNVGSGARVGRSHIIAHSTFEASRRSAGG